VIPAPARTRGQQGFTLIELLVAMAIAMAIVLPLLAWMVLGFRQQQEVTQRAQEDSGMAFASAYFPRDVNSANGEDPAVDCTSPAVPVPAASQGDTTTTSLGAPSPPTPPGAPVGSETAVLALRYDDNGAPASRTVYVVVDDTDGGVLERHQCDATGVLVDSSRVADGLVPPLAGWPAMVVRTPRAGYPAGDQGHLTLSLTGRSGRTTSLSAELRTGGMR
jgi:prepilin-type N-terminal cleavage/methylation domain-containing protein